MLYHSSTGSGQSHRNTTRLPGASGSAGTERERFAPSIHSVLLPSGYSSALMGRLMNLYSSAVPAWMPMSALQTFPSCQASGAERSGFQPPTSGWEPTTNQL